MGKVYGGYWKLRVEKVFFNGSVSTILQLVVVSGLISLAKAKFALASLDIRSFIHLHKVSQKKFHICKHNSRF